jgi:hypothetical protein
MTDLRQLTDDLDQLREELDWLISLVEPDLDPTTGVLAGPPVPGVGAPAGRAGRANAWHTLTPSEAGHAWKALTEWVDWLLDRYCLDDTIPACWYRHGAMTDELDALRAAWVAAYLDPHAKPLDGAVWHDLLDRALTRLRNWDRYGCSAGTHHDDTPTPVDPADRQARTDHLHRQIDTGARRLRSVPTDVPTDVPSTG